MSMQNEDIYRKAIKELFQKTCGKTEHYEEKVIELFDKLLDEDIKCHCDTVEKMCKDVGYDEYASKEIAQIYDVISLYKLYKKSRVKYWDISELVNP